MFLSEAEQEDHGAEMEEWRSKLFSSHTTLVDGAIGAIDLTVPEPDSIVVLGTALIELVPLWRLSGRSRRRL